MVSFKIQNTFFFYFRSKQKEKQFGNVPDRKKPYIVQKNDLFTESKNWGSSKGVSPWFWSKIRNFLLLLFLIKREKNTLVMFQIESNPIQTRKVTFLLNRKIGILLKRLVHGCGPNKDRNKNSLVMLQIQKTLYRPEK